MAESFFHLMSILPFAIRHTFEKQFYQPTKQERGEK